MYAVQFSFVTFQIMTDGVVNDGDCCLCCFDKITKHADLQTIWPLKLRSICLKILKK